MSRLFAWMLLAALAGACGRGDGVVRGSVAADGDADELQDIWIVGREGRERVADGRFEVTGVAPGLVDLRLGDDTGERARVLIQDLPRGAALTLHELSVDRPGGLALPARIEVDGGHMLSINGIRMASPERLPRQIHEDGTVLAISPSADALLVRPHDDRLPDLRVVVSPATETSTPDGDPADPADLAVGDTIRVEGSVEDRYVVAARMVLPRHSVVRSAPADAGGSAAPAAAAPARRDDAGEQRGRRRDPPGRRGEGRGRGRGNN